MLHCNINGRLAHSNPLPSVTGRAGKEETKAGMGQRDAKGISARPNPGSWYRIVAAGCLGLGLAACGGESVSTEDRLSGAIPRPQKVTDARAELGQADFPNLASVPDAPPETTTRQERAQVMSALEADRGAAGLAGGPRTVGAADARGQHIADIYFAQASARLDSQDREILRSVAELTRSRGGRLRIVGHSSQEVADAEALRQSLTNFQISLARARGVAEALERLGVAPDRLLVEALTDRDPIYRESTPEGAAGNRRVEIFQEFL